MQKRRLGKRLGGFGSWARLHVSQIPPSRMPPEPSEPVLSDAPGEATMTGIEARRCVLQESQRAAEGCPNATRP